MACKPNLTPKVEYSPSKYVWPPSLHVTVSAFSFNNTFKIKILRGVNPSLLIDKSKDDGEIDDCGHPPTSPHHAGGEGLFINQVEDVHCD